MYSLLKFLIIIFALLISFSSCRKDKIYNWENHTKEMTDSLKLFESKKILTGRTIGIGGKVSDQWKLKNWILKNGSYDEFINLKKHPNCLLRVLAYEGILKYSEKIEFNILEEALLDTSTFEYLNGCIGEDKFIGEYLFEDLVDVTNIIPMPPNLLDHKLELSETERIELTKIYRNKKY